MDNQINEMLTDGLIKPSISPWSSPVVLVSKKDGSSRFCVDFRALNEVTIKDPFPLSRIDESLQSLGGAKYFTTLDLAAGYWEVELEQRDREKTAFTTPRGHFQFEVIPFGLCNAPRHLPKVDGQSAMWTNLECLLDRRHCLLSHLR